MIAKDPSQTLAADIDGRVGERRLAGPPSVVLDSRGERQRESARAARVAGHFMPCRTESSGSWHPRGSGRVPWRVPFVQIQHPLCLVWFLRR